MRAYGLMLVMLAAWAGTAMVGFSQDDHLEVFVLEPGGDAPKVVIKGEVTCANPDGRTMTKSCPTISDSDAKACPTGSCFADEFRGCLYYPPVNGTPKSRYLIKKNDSAQYKYPYRASRNMVGKETKEKPDSRVICYQEYQCSCKELPDGSGICTSKRGADVAIVEYEVTDKNCVGGVVSTEVPE
jgi:hypothetical protein